VPATVGGVETISFEDAFDAEARETFGDLGPGASTESGERSGDRGDRGSRGDRHGGDHRRPRRR
jgi:hypothetical protein